MATEIAAISFCFFARCNQTQLGLFLALATESLISNVWFLSFPFPFFFLGLHSQEPL